MANQNLDSLLQFRDATRAQAKACIVIQGLSGKGKSGLALIMGYYLAEQNWRDVYCTDTENRSLDLFEGIGMHTGITLNPPFRKLDLLPTHGYAPRNYLVCKNNAIKAGAKVHINDSLTHMWQMQGGVLQRVTEIEKANVRVNKFTAWGTDEITAEKNAIYDVVRDSNIHIISTVRVKEKHEFVDKEVRSLGEQQIFMPDFKYEPDLVLDMVSAGRADGTPPVAKVLKSRYNILAEGETYEFTESLIMALVAYLNEGADPEVLKEAQRQEMIVGLTEILNRDESKRTMLPILKEQIGVKDTPLTDLTLEKIRTLIGILIN